MGSRLRTWAGRILAGVGVLTLLWGAYVLVVPESSDRLPTRIGSLGGTPGSPSFVRTLAWSLDVPVLEGNRIVPLHNGEEIFPALVAGIAGARESVDFLTYVYWRGDIARRVAGELAAAARRGVRVRVLLDAYGSQRMRGALVDSMEAAGVEVVRYHPLHPLRIREVNNRTHRKVLVVDGRLAFTGGVGIADEWAGDARDSTEWRDVHFRVEGPAVHALRGAFAENWRQATGEVPGGEDAYPELDSAGTSTVVPLLTRPGSISEIGFLYWLTLHSARRHVRIATPYLLPEPGLLDALTAAARRGVTVEILVPGRHNDHRLVRAASLTFYRPLIESGVRLYEFTPSMMHAKVVIVDGAWSVVGSPNFDNRSFELNYEVALGVADSSLAAALAGAFDRDLERARPVTLEEVERWGPLERLRQHAAGLLREQL